MAKFNKKSSGSMVKSKNADTVNEEGAPAYSMDDYNELTSRVLTCLVNEPKFYDKEGKGDNEIIKLVSEMSDKDPEYILKLASFARNEMNLRSVPTMLLVESATHEGTRQFVRKYTPSIVKRADELCETIAYYQNKFGHIGDAQADGMLPNSLKRGLADTIKYFDAYALAKYDRQKASVKMRDVFRIVHPKPSNKKQSKLWKSVIDNTIESPDTWEVAISTKGSTKENWEEIFPSMGYMATIRNMRNALKVDVDDKTIKGIIKTITDADNIRKSKQFPFRFYSAYRSLDNENLGLESFDAKKRNKLQDALLDALEISVENIPELSGTTFITADNSGSMDTVLSAKSSMKYNDIANLFQAMISRKCKEVITSVFGENFATVNASKKDSIITNAEKFKNTDVGHSTNAYKALEWLLESNTKVDRVIIFSDMQCYGEDSLSNLWNQYKRKNPKARLYSIDLAGYGTAQFPKNDKSVTLISGWSDRVLDLITKIEDPNGMVKTVMNYKPKERIIKED